MMRSLFLLAYGLLLIASIYLIYWATQELTTDEKSRVLIVNLGADAFKTILGATIGAMASMIAGYLDYKSDKAAIRNEAIKVAMNKMSADELARFVNALD